MGQVCEQAITQKIHVAELLRRIPEVAQALGGDIDTLAGPGPQIAACQPMCSAVLHQWQTQKILIQEE